MMCLATREKVGPIAIGLRRFLYPHFSSYYIHSFLLVFVLCFSVSFGNYQSHAHVHVFHIFYSHTEGNLLFFSTWIDFVFVGEYY